MIEFRPVRLEDRAAIERFTLPSDIRNCDLAFANMFCWQTVYRSSWAVVEGFLVVRFHIGGGTRIGYMQPVGEGDFTRIVPALEADARAHGQRLRLIGLTDQGRELLRNSSPGTFAFHSDRASEDYIYRACSQGRAISPSATTSTASQQPAPTSATRSSRPTVSTSA